MDDRFKEFGRRAISGEIRSWAARLTRVLTAVVEPAYATAMRVRNRLYDLQLVRTHDLGRPTISVGNLTTGGTGKTPLVAWLAAALRSAGHRPAVLLRGYGSTGQDGDEPRALRRALGPDVPVYADPSRVAGAAAVLRDHPAVDLFLLDDGFQHRRAARQVDLVVISATEPFGHGHVLPRGLLREPPSGLRRATAVVLTRCDAVTDVALASIEQAVRRNNPGVPIFRTDHVHAGLWLPAANAELPIDALTTDPFFAVAAIGDPAALDRQLRVHGDRYVGHRWFADHHRYTSADVASIRSEAGAAGIVTTEKDWVKLADLPEVDRAAIRVLRLTLRFHRDGEAALLRHVAERLSTSPAHP